MIGLDWVWERHNYPNSPRTAAERYRALAVSPDRTIRAAALARLARAVRNQGKVTDALAAYDALAELNETPVFGSPAEFLVRRERIALFTAASNTQDAAHEAQQLAGSLAARHYLVDRAEFDYSCEFAPCESIDTSLAEAAAAFMPMWRQSADGRHEWRGEHGMFVTAWRSSGDGRLAIVGPLDALLDGGSRRDARLRFTIEDQKGRRIWGAAPGLCHASVGHPPQLQRRRIEIQTRTRSTAAARTARQPAPRPRPPRRGLVSTGYSTMR